MRSGPRLRGFFLFLLALLFHSSLFAQLHLKLQLLPDSTSWGVFVKPDSTIVPSTNTITGSGQVTIVAPAGFQYSGLELISGAWLDNSRVNAPDENPERDYISFGFLADNPQIVLHPNEETLLFTFQMVGDCPDSLYLIDNQSDPLMQSHTTNPGNDISIIDLGNGLLSYHYAGNYDLNAWNCHPPEQVISASEAIFKSEEIRISPNPATDWINVKFQQPLTATIEISLWNLKGQLLFSKRVEPNLQSSAKLNVQEHPSGMYILVIKQGESTLKREQIILKR